MQRIAPLTTSIHPSTATEKQQVTCGFTAQLINELGQVWNIPSSSTQFISSSQVKVTVFLGSGPTSTQTIKIANPDGQSAQINFTVLAGLGNIKWDRSAEINS